MIESSLLRQLGQVGVACVFATLLAACATSTRQLDLPAVAGDPASHQQQRATALATVADWSAAGRVALSNGKNDGGSGRLDWQQQGSGYQVSLSAPITRQSWRLSGQPGQALLEGLEGGPRQGPDARALLLEATRWDIPVDALTAWLRGIRADESVFGAAEVSFGDDRRVSRIVQDGWTIDYGGWQEATGFPVELPQRLTATRGESRVRLVVDSWQGGSVPSP